MTTRISLQEYRNMAGWSGDARRANPAPKLQEVALHPADTDAYPQTFSNSPLAPAQAGEFSGFTLTLALSPTTNNLFVNVKGKGRVPSAEYMRWTRLAKVALSKVQAQAMGGQFNALVRVPAKMRGDVDNRAKAILDILKKAQLIRDDKFCDALTVMRSHAVAPRTCIVTITHSKFDRDKAA